VCVVVGAVSSRPPVSLRDAVHAGGRGGLHAGGPPGCLPRILNILGTARYPRCVTAPSVRRRSGVIPEHRHRLKALIADSGTGLGDLVGVILRECCAVVSTL
jgi:hypothetical protein